MNSCPSRGAVADPQALWSLCDWERDSRLPEKTNMWCEAPHAYFASHGPRHTFILARSVSYRPRSREHVYKVQLSFAKATRVPSLLEETKCMTYSQMHLTDRIALLKPGTRHCPWHDDASHIEATYSARTRMHRLRVGARLLGAQQSSIESRQSTDREID